VCNSSSLSLSVSNLLLSSRSDLYHRTGSFEMTSSSASAATSSLPPPPKSVWKSVEYRKLPDTPSSHPPIPAIANGHFTDDTGDKESISSKDKDSVSSKHEGSLSSKDVQHSGDAESQGHLTPASSWADDVPHTSSPPPPKSVPAPVIRPAPIPPVNPWFARQREQERKKWEESSQTVPAVIPPESAKPVQVPKPAPKANGVVGTFCVWQGLT